MPSLIHFHMDIHWKSGKTRGTSKSKSMTRGHPICTFNDLLICNLDGFRIGDASRSEGEFTLTLRRRRRTLFTLTGISSPPPLLVRCCCCCPLLHFSHPEPPTEKKALPSPQTLACSPADTTWSLELCGPGNHSLRTFIKEE